MRDPTMNLNPAVCSWRRLSRESIPASARGKPCRTVRSPTVMCGSMRRSLRQSRFATTIVLFRFKIQRRHVIESKTGVAVPADMVKALLGQDAAVVIFAGSRKVTKDRLPSGRALPQVSDHSARITLRCWFHDTSNDQLFEYLITHLVKPQRVVHLCQGVPQLSCHSMHRLSSPSSANIFTVWVFLITCRTVGEKRQDFPLWSIPLPFSCAVKKRDLVVPGEPAPHHNPKQVETTGLSHELNATRLPTPHHNALIPDVR